MLLLTGAILLAYLLGSLSGSLLLGRLRGVDIRREGSGNAGGTNAFRTLGWRFALGVVLIDIGKGVLSAWLGLHFGAVAPAPLDGAYAQGALCGFAAVIGHCWPLFFGFRGGKGAGTAAGAVIVLAPVLVVPVVAVWGLVLIATGYVGLATMIAAVAFALLASTLTVAAPGAEPALTAFAIAIALLIVFTHRENIERLVRGTEFRFDKARLLHRLAQRLRTKTLLLALVLPACLFSGDSEAQAPRADDGIAAAVQLIRTQAVNHRLILLGEVHGTREIPRLVGALVDDWSRSERIELALEIPETERAALQRYLASDGGTAARSRLRQSPFWNVTNTDHDGRRSEDVLTLIERVRALRHADRAIELVPYDNPTATLVDSETRDRQMAERLRAAYESMHDGRLLVLAGNVHAMLGRPSYAPPEMQAPMGSRLHDLDPYSINIAAASGEVWLCGQHCGPHPLTPRSGGSGPDDDDAYDYEIVLPHFSVARLLGSHAAPSK